MPLSHRIWFRSLILLITLLLFPAPSAKAGIGRRKVSHRQVRANQVGKLFQNEIRHAEDKLKWRGPRLSDDTLYALALTGASWESAWGKETLFSLAWGGGRSFAVAHKVEAQNSVDIVRQIKSSYEQKDYRKTVETAIANFSLDEIGLDISLKETVGQSFMALGKPEQAFPIFSAPFEMSPSETRSAFYNRKFREMAFEAAERAGLTREAIVFAVSLVLSPGVDAPSLQAREFTYLENAGVDLDRILLGVIQAPEKLPRLPGYVYYATDLMSLRASPKFLRALTTLATSKDPFFQSRALLGLGVVGYRLHVGEPEGWSQRLLTYSPKVFEISSELSKLIEKRLKEGLNSDKYQVRAASALSIALIDSEDAPSILKKMSKDRAFLLTLGEAGQFNSRLKRIQFPVRTAASIALARFNIKIETGEGEFAGKQLDQAKRGGQDVSKEKTKHIDDKAESPSLSPLERLNRS